MHILGKVLLWLCVILLLPASLILTSMTLDVRHRWLNDVATRQKRVEDGLKQIAETEKRVRLLSEERQSLVHSWGDVWNAPNSQAQPGTGGAVELGVGSSSGLPQRAQDAKADPAVFVFADNSGNTQYLGEFRVTDMRPAQAVIRLSRTPYPQETDSWPRGTYHVRSTLPANWLTTIADLQGQQVIAESLLVDQQLELGIRKQLIASSQATLTQRMAELNGNPDAAEEFGSEVKDGLVESLKKYETARNDQLAAVDRLRHQLVRQYNQLRHTIDRAVEKADALNQKYGPQDAPSNSGEQETAANGMPTPVR